MNKILISGCLLGELVRYDGKSKPITNPMIKQWYQQGRLVSVCPEVAGGLPIPRPPAERQPNGQIMTRQGINVTEKFNAGAQKALDLCKQHNIKVAILKQGSPSCGSSTIYDGSFSATKIAGEGKTCQLLRQHGIHVFCENTLEQAMLLVDS
jgi:uncharacterized protein YbbK (DUF523 family)